MKTNSERKDDKRKRLFKEQGGRCHWCGNLMAINWKKNYANQIPENAATFEHLIDRNQENRKMYRAIKGQQCVVLACYKCNHERGTVRNKQRQMSEKNEAKRANARPQ